MYSLRKHRFLIVIILCFFTINIFGLGGIGRMLVEADPPTLSSIRINEQLPAYGSTRLTVTGTYSDGTSYLISSGVVWSSSNTDIAIVDSNGNVAFTGRRGSVTISATYGDRSHSVSVTTQQASSSSTYITINGLPNYCVKGSVYNLTVQAVYSDNSVEVLNNRYVTFTCSDTNVATVSPEGVVSVHGTLGAFMITATYRDKSTIFVSVVSTADWTPTQNTISTSGELIGLKIIGDVPKEPFQSKKLEIKGEYSDGYYRDVPGSVTWTSSNNNVVRVTSDGTVYYGGNYGVATITASYMKYKDSISINIDKSQQVYQEQRQDDAAQTIVYDRQKSYFNENIVDAGNIITILEQLKNSNQTNTASFRDIKNHWAEKDIKTAEALGIISGFADNSFKPDNKITRAEFAAIICKAFSVRYYIDDANKIFKDVEGKWYQDSVMALRNAGIINGYADGTFRPNNNITKAEMVAIISRLIVKEDMEYKDSMGKYNDIASSYWAKKDIDKLYSLGALEYIGKSKLDPNKTATRAEVVSVIVKLLQNIERNSK